MQVVESGGGIREVHSIHALGHDWTEWVHPYITTRPKDQGRKKCLQGTQDYKNPCFLTNCLQKWTFS